MSWKSTGTGGCPGPPPLSCKAFEMALSDEWVNFRRKEISANPKLSVREKATRDKNIQRQTNEENVTPPDSGISRYTLSQCRGEREKTSGAMAGAFSAVRCFTPLGNLFSGRVMY